MRERGGLDWGEAIWPRGLQIDLGLRTALEENRVRW